MCEYSAMGRTTLILGDELMLRLRQFAAAESFRLQRHVTLTEIVTEAIHDHLEDQPGAPLPQPEPADEEVPV